MLTCLKTLRRMKMKHMPDLFQRRLKREKKSLFASLPAPKQPNNKPKPTQNETKTNIPPPSSGTIDHKKESDPSGEKVQIHKPNKPKTLGAVSSMLPPQIRSKVKNPKIPDALLHQPAAPKEQTNQTDSATCGPQLPPSAGNYNAYPEVAPQIDPNSPGFAGAQQLQQMGLPPPPSFLRRDLGQGGVSFVDVNSNDLAQHNYSEDFVREYKQRTKNPSFTGNWVPSDSARRQHQITWLARQVELGEAQRAYAKSQSFKTKAETWGKYGWS
eukprot:TRINITY_DN16309_c0_g1_i1.p1 TRINITY_DN16309_c0_g1~~TRINITY_DN16309_c0_g1_i1.p1  ORF type:complete len:270 (-),score=58.19 TRINITY_DN16309_c0_g1_i1:73-882(-)